MRQVGNMVHKALKRLTETENEHTKDTYMQAIQLKLAMLVEAQGELLPLVDKIIP